MKVEIREAKDSEWREVMILNSDLFKLEVENFDGSLDVYWPEKHENYFKKSIKDDNSLTLIAIVEGKIVGYLIGSVCDSADYRKKMKMAEIDNTFILEKFRRKKIGKGLFEKFIDWAISKKAIKIEVTASAKNKRAISFYRNQGFEDYNLTLEKDV